MSFGGACHLGDKLFHAPRAKPYQYVAELHLIFVTYHLCGLTIIDTTDNLYEMCPNKLKNFGLPCTVDHAQNLTGAAYSPNGFY